MAPPVRQSQSWAGAPAVWPAANRPDVLPSSETMASSGRSAPTIWQTASAVSAPVGSSGRSAGCRVAASGAAPTASASAARAAAGSPSGPASTWTVQPVGHEVAGLVGIGEERHGRLRVDEDQVAQAVELHGGELGEVGEAVDRHPAGAALEPSGERLGEELGAGGVGDAAGVDEGVGPAGAPADEQARRLVALEHRRQLGDERGVDGGGRGRLDRGRGIAAVGPAHVGRQDQRGDLARGTDGRGDGVGGVARRPPWCCRRTGSSSTRCARRSRCRSRAGRRTACGRWRGRRRC